MILQGDCLQVLKTLDAGAVQTCVTSPPYYGLRDYGTASWEGGNAECDHKAPPAGGTGESSKLQVMRKRVDFDSGIYKSVCGKCGAVRIDDQIGLEETPELYVEKLVAVFREVRRVLKDDGTLWLNLGDSYAGSGGPGSWVDNKQTQSFKGEFKKYDNPNRKVAGIKPKDLIGIPWMVAFALRADGWYLRSDIIWAKPNPMPESVTDRPTKSHEYIFLLSKSAQYYYDYEAILEPIARAWGENNIGPNNRINTGILEGKVLGRKENPHGGLSKTLPRMAKHKNLESDGQRPHSMHVNRAKGLGEPQSHTYGLSGEGFKGHSGNYDSEGNLLTHEKDGAPARNKRTVWTVTTKPYKGSHFAVFPPDLIEPCILAGSRVGDVVLDPFNGSGTTGSVAIKHHRQYLGIELNESYIELSNKRLSQTQPVLFPQ